MTSSDPWNVPLGIEDRSGIDDGEAGRTGVEAGAGTEGRAGVAGAGVRAGGGAGVRAGGAAGVRAGGGAGVRTGGAAVGRGGGIRPGRVVEAAGARVPVVLTGSMGGVWAHAPSGPAVIAVA